MLRREPSKLLPCLMQSNYSLCVIVYTVKDHVHVIVGVLSIARAAKFDKSVTAIVSKGKAR